MSTSHAMSGKLGTADGLRIGIVGHRPNHPLGAEIPTDIQLALEMIETIARTDKQFTLVSGLAEGADQMAAAVKPAGWRLEGILPFSLEEYERDFTEAADGSKRDMRPAFRDVVRACDRITAIASNRDDSQAYHRSGLFMLGTLDLLIAVWNGELPRGPGGTGDIVRAAAEAEIPVLWIASGERQAIRLITGQRVGWQFNVTDNPAVLEEFLKTYIKGEDAQSQPRIGHGPALTEAAKAGAFQNERWPIGKGPQVYAVMKNLLSRKGRGAVNGAGSTDSWKYLLDATPPAPQLRAELDREIRPLYERSDKLAVYYADTYRSAYVMTYVAAFFAVVLALAGLIIPHEYPTDTQVDLKAVLVALELLIVGLIVSIVIIGTRNRWHQKWMDYRAMAEMLRHVRFLAYLGAHRRFGVSARHGTVRMGSWTNRMVDQAASRVGVPDARIDQAYIATLAKAVRDHEVETQLHYHTGNARRLYRMNTILHGAGDWCFYLTGALLLAFLVGYGLEQSALFSVGGHGGAAPEHGAPGGLLGLLYASKAFVGFFGAALPALGAALSGIRFTGEFETLGSRSEAMAFSLFDLRRRYGELIRTPDFDHSAATLMETAAILSADIDDWKTLYTHKRLSLPA
ncbi:DUF4231 domain-containing protein (plasmid) [Agrobacterium vitis]|uniref:DUF4231 domain-containing protein n=1 Tax=Agrobacterium vitis TaxID=373 RepID=UPI003D2729C1